MLKIKDTFDLKKLEKFGFVYRGSEYALYSLGGYPCGGGIFLTNERILDFDDEWWGDDFDIIDNLYDLIQAGLVEKVKE